MFGKNEIVGQKFFKEYDDDKLLVTSYFFTLQGEGPFRGKSAFFIRLSKCNLACSFCDTYFDSGDMLSFDDLDQRIEESIQKYFESMDLNLPTWASMYDWNGQLKPRDMVLVITGGEPMLQKNLGSFLETQVSKFKHIQIESNGTVYQELPEKVTLVVSPKCLEKNGVAIKYLQPNEKVLSRANCLKFVMSADQNSPYSEIPDWAHAWASFNDKDIFISPMNIYNSEPQKSKNIRSVKNDINIEERSVVDEVISFWEVGLLNMSENQKNHEYVGKYCIIHGYVMNLQVHLFASLA